MGPQVLLIPALFVTICVTFIILHSCYHRWKMSDMLKKKREAAKISLVNILQMTNATLITPAWSANGETKSKIKPTVFVSDDTTSNHSCPSYPDDKEKENSHFSTFNPRNPNVLSSILTINDQHALPPPCYEDLYGHGRAVFTFKSLSPEREEPPPFSSHLQSRNEEQRGRPCSDTLQCEAETGNSPCLLQVPQQDVPMRSQERRNSSAVLYL